jgi:predicted GH43/DUF377 family glycosyl hydrolase
MKQNQSSRQSREKSREKFGPLAVVSIIACLSTAISAQTEWFKHPENPVLSPGLSGTWDDNYLIEPYVLFDGTNYKIWYGGHDGANSRIGYATSPDGVDWTKYSGNPVLDLGASGSWDDRHVETPVVLMFDDTTFFMWYGGRRDATPVEIGLASSSDGIEWEKWSTNPVMNAGIGWDNEGIFPQAVILIDDTLRMWYFGLNSTFEGRSGYATSSDGGVEWAKYEGNPILDIGDAGAWDDVTAAVGAVLFDGTKYEMWYDSWDGANSGSIGYATAPDSIPTNAITDAGVIPDGYVLSQNYPNPFNPVSTIGYELPQGNHISLAVYDILGHEITRLVDGYLEPGYHEVLWNGRDFPSGIYIARLVTPEYSRSIKMVLLK